MKKNKKIPIISIICIISIVVTVIEAIMGIIVLKYPCSPCLGGCCEKTASKFQVIHDIYESFTSIYTIIAILILILIPIIIYKGTKKTIVKSTVCLFIIALLLNIVPTMISIAYNLKYNTIEVKKPIIYIYPTEKTKLTITLDNEEKILYSYPKYDKSWEIIVDKDSTIYDLKTKRNYYALFWEGTDNTKVDKTEGFVVPGKDTRTFLEEKLEYLGLNDKELNEFIIYWLPKLENNKYTYIRFRAQEEIESYNKININHKVDSLIQVYMDFKPLDKKIKVKEQKLEKKERTGFTVVEWGGREIE